MIRIRTKVGDKRVFTLMQGDKWVTFATGLQHKDSATLAEAAQHHLMSARALYLKDLEDEHRRNNPHFPIPGETWNVKV